MKRLGWLLSYFFVILMWQAFSYAENLRNINKMDKVYSDESHCLVSAELRVKKDNSISCYCRDAIMDARYVYENYLSTGKDPNLNGAYLALWDHVQQVCGQNCEFLKATQTKEWQWNGPQVTREYPPENEINKIQPDTNGFRIVEYKVHLTYIDAGGLATKVESFSAVEKLPSNFKK